MPTSLQEEADRLALIRSWKLLSLAGRGELQDIADAAAFAFDVPTVLITVVEESEQHFLGKVGMPLDGTRREASICTHAIGSVDLLEVSDLSKDARFRESELVAGPSGMRFYAGAPLVLDGGVPVGTLCLIDYAPRQLTARERGTLRRFANIVESQIRAMRSVGYRDAVTGLPNRQQMRMDMLELGQRRPGPHRLCMIELLDSSAASGVVQAVGIGPVESLVRQVGYRVSDALPEGVTVYQAGVTRIAFITQSADRDLDTLMTLLQQIVLEPVSAYGLKLQAVFHCGIAQFSPERDDPADVIRRGVIAMHGTVEQRRAWGHYEGERDVGLQRRHRLGADVEAGLQHDHFALVYQPRLDLARNAVQSAEALLRWNHPELGRVGPDEFIPIVESTTLMPQVSSWVMAKAAAQLAEWDKQGLRLNVSVNLSAADFKDGHLLRRMDSLVQQLDTAPGRLELEITESEWLRGVGSVREQLEGLRDRGYILALDDFGAGYSNFAYLNDLPFSVIKLDRTLIDGIERSDRRQRLVRSFLKLAEDLDYRTVAEGVEKPEQLEMLRAWGCNEVQGYLIARPMAPSDPQWSHLPLATRAATLLDTDPILRCGTAPIEAAARVARIPRNRSLVARVTQNVTSRPR